MYSASAESKFGGPGGCSLEPEAVTMKTHHVQPENVDPLPLQESIQFPLDTQCVKPESQIKKSYYSEPEHLTLKHTRMEASTMPWYKINRETSDHHEIEEKDKICQEQIAFLDFSFFPTGGDNSEDEDPQKVYEPLPHLDVDALGGFTETPCDHLGELPSIDSGEYADEKSDPNALNSISIPAPVNFENVEQRSSEINWSSDQPRIKAYQEEMWNIRYKELLEFIKQKGHAAVPHTYPQNQPLARWVKRQRRQFKNGCDGRASTLTPERIDLLRSIGFIWDSHEVQWRENLHSLQVFREKFGHCNVQTGYIEKKLAIWVKCQRRQYKLFWDGKSSAMSLERIQELEKLGFQWEIRATPDSSEQSVMSEEFSQRNPAPKAY